MYYINFDICSISCDYRRKITHNLFLTLHKIINVYKGKIGIGFPKWNDFYHGDCLRLFAEKKEYLEYVLKNNEIQEIIINMKDLNNQTKKLNINLNLSLKISSIKIVPENAKPVFFIRNRSYEKVSTKHIIKKRLKLSNKNLKEINVERTPKNSENLHHIMLYSFSEKTYFSLFIEREYGDVSKNDFNSYGLSHSDSLNKSNVYEF